MESIPDIAETEQWVEKTTLRERYGRGVGFQRADAEGRLHPSDRGLGRRPAIDCESDDGYRFAIVKTGERADRSQRSSASYRPMGSGAAHRDDRAACAVALLNARADHVDQQRGDLPTRRQ